MFESHKFIRYYHPHHHGLIIAIIFSITTARSLNDMNKYADRDIYPLQSWTFSTIIHINISMDMISTIYVAQKLLAIPKLILRSCSFCPPIVLGLIFFCPLLETFQLIHPLKIFHRHVCPLLVGGVPTNNWLKMYTGLFTFGNMPIMIIYHRLMLVLPCSFFIALTLLALH